MILLLFYYLINYRIVFLFNKISFQQKIRWEVPFFASILLLRSWNIYFRFVQWTAPAWLGMAKSSKRIHWCSPYFLDKISPWGCEEARRGWTTWCFWSLSGTLVSASDLPSYSEQEIAAESAHRSPPPGTDLSQSPHWKLILNPITYLRDNIHFMSIPVSSKTSLAAQSSIFSPSFIFPFGNPQHPFTPRVDPKVKMKIFYQDFISLWTSRTFELDGFKIIAPDVGIDILYSNQLSTISSTFCVWTRRKGTCLQHLLW